MTDLANATQVKVESCFLGIWPCSTSTRAITQSERLGFALNRLSDWASDHSSSVYPIGVFRDDSKLGGVTNGGAQLFGGTQPLSIVRDDRPLTSAAHEIGHGLGRVHAGLTCGSNGSGQVGEAWPPNNDGALDGIGLDTRLPSPYSVISSDRSGRARHLLRPHVLLREHERVDGRRQPPRRLGLAAQLATRPRHGRPVHQRARAAGRLVRRSLRPHAHRTAGHRPDRVRAPGVGTQSARGGGRARRRPRGSRRGRARRRRAHARRPQPELSARGPGSRREDPQHVGSGPAGRAHRARAAGPPAQRPRPGRRRQGRRGDERQQADHRTAGQRPRADGEDPRAQGGDDRRARRPGGHDPLARRRRRPRDQAHRHRAVLDRRRPDVPDAVDRGRPPQPAAPGEAVRRIAARPRPGPRAGRLPRGAGDLGPLHGSERPAARAHRLTGGRIQLPRRSSGRPGRRGL